MDDLANAKSEREKALAYKEKYGQKLKEVDKEAQEILTETRKKAMKMETNILASMKGKVEKINVKDGQQVKAGELIAVIG
jgi:F0F1-type ATP synthase membrane subunit b/b'